MSSTQQFQCRKCLNICKTAKHNSTASSKKRENHLEPSVPLRAHFEVEPSTPATVAYASLLFTAPEAPFTLKNTMFRANPNIQSASMMCENEAFVRGFLQFPKLEDVTCTTLSCKTQYRLACLLSHNCFALCLTYVCAQRSHLVFFKSVTLILKKSNDNAVKVNDKAQ